MSTGETKDMDYWERLARVVKGLDPATIEERCDAAIELCHEIHGTPEEFWARVTQGEHTEVVGG